MLDNNLQNQLRVYLEKLTRPVTLIACLDDSKASEDVGALLAQISSLSENITTERDDNLSARKPSFMITQRGQRHGPVFSGSPLGHEFTSLVLALLQTGGHPSKESQELLTQVAALDDELHFETYYSLTCHNCPDVVQALNLMAIINPKISHTAIDGGVFNDEVEQRQIMGVPAIFLNGQSFGQGRMSLGEIISKADSGAAEKSAQALTARAPYDVLIVGSGPAGVAAAVYAARKGIRTALIGERFGGQVLDTVDIENYISVPKTVGSQLAGALRQHVDDYQVDVIEAQSISRLTPAADLGAYHRLETLSGATLAARSVIIATGARWRNMNVPGEEAYRTKGVTYCPHCDGPLFKGKRVAVIGGGNSGAEAAIDLAGLTEQVTLLEFAPELKADQVLQDKLRTLNNVEIIVNAQTTEVTGDGQQVTGLSYVDRVSGEARSLALSGIFVQIGLLPNTQWLEGTIERNRMGEIVVDAKNETSQPGIFAAGDCTTVPYKQIIVACGEGAKASLSAFDYLIRTPTP